MTRKKHIGTAGRFGVKYGKRIRAKVNDIEKVQRLRHLCPTCDMPHVKRNSNGIWICRKCGTKFTGQAYYPTGHKIKEE